MAKAKKKAAKKATEEELEAWLGKDFEPATDHDHDGINSVAVKPESMPKKSSKGKTVRLEYDTPGAAAQGCRVRKYTDGSKELVPKE